MIESALGGNSVKRRACGLSCAASTARARRMFDAAVCVGNSLALAPDRATAAGQSARCFPRCAGGRVVIVHTMNLWRLADGPCLWQKCLRARLRPPRRSPDRQGVHRAGDRGFVELIVASLDDHRLRSESVPFWGWRLPSWRTRRAGRRRGGEFLRWLSGRPYDRASSVDLVMVARKADRD